MSDSHHTRRSFLSQAGIVPLSLGAGLSSASSISSDSSAPSSSEWDPPGMEIDSLNRAIQAVIDAKRIGQPVFVRISAFIAEQTHPATVGLSLLGIAQRWLGSKLNRVYATHSQDDDSFSITGETPLGSTVIVGVAQTASWSAGLDVLIVGNHGAIYHDEGLANLWKSTSEIAQPAPEMKPLADAIRESIAKGEVIEIPLPDQP